ncbi:Rrp15p-domain-containing protein [Lentinula aff. detonsa]|uniref:Rrp15p-domain-containing protein n=1 Tax=Lentinula aff. detonsa TaxID=2804958 RepID=A0AA38U2I6_9AGAR|nr:Rrp15p-domain-containing protein [Lentinula aff. detonsa]
MSSHLKRKSHSVDVPENHSDVDEQSVNVSAELSENSEEESIDGQDEMTDSADEIDGMKPQKSRQTKKRKIRATHASAFGATLQSLLNTKVPSSAPLSLKPSIARKRNDEKLEMKAKKVLQVEKKEKEDKGRITDVIGGWGGESERALRKVAQRGVVKLFNVVQNVQTQQAVEGEEKKAARGSGKPSLPAPVIVDRSKSKKGKNKDNIIGRGKDSALDKEDFFDMLRSGAVVSKS